jgi:PII-like signaling protein
VAAGATSLRGIWGYHGDHPPHGDRLLALRRKVPVLTVVVDRPDRIDGWCEIIDD